MALSDDALSLSSDSPLSSPEDVDDEILPDAPPAPSAPVESLVAGRSRRSTAGNLLAKLLLQEADEEDTLFLEDEDDVEFTAKDINEPDDIPLESSSEDEDEGPPPPGEEEDLEGEKALLQAEREAKKAKRRKTDDAFFKRRATAVPKRVTIREDRTTVAGTGTDVTNSSAASPGAMVDSDGYTALNRPRKKSERISWVPEFVATRASSRTLSLQNRETTMKKLEESEKRRLHTIALMEAAAARKEKKAGSRKEMTQEERLEEAKKTERRNLRSLTRWEEMEKAKLEEQRKKLAALQNRKLAGPVITYWSGKAEWDGDGKLVKLGKRLIEELEVEGSKKKKPKPRVKDDEKAKEKEKDKPAVDTPSEAASTKPPEEGAIVPATAAIDTPPTNNPSSTENPPSAPDQKPPSTSSSLTENPNPPAHNPSAPSASTTKGTPPEPEKASATESVPAAPQPVALPSPPKPPSFSARNILVLDNFEPELRDKLHVMRALCGNQVRRPQAPTAKPICVITHQPARFCDPATGMPYSSLHAYKEIRRILHGDIRWSQLLGAYVGEVGKAAKGVPEGF